MQISQLPEPDCVCDFEGDSQSCYKYLWLAFYMLYRGMGAFAYDFHRDNATLSPALQKQTADWNSS